MFTGLGSQAILTPEDVEDGYRLIYCIGQEDTGLVKIGVTSNSLKARLSQIQVGSPELLVILGCVRGTSGTEQRIHEILGMHRMRGEWFHREPALALFDRFNYQPQFGTFYFGGILERMIDLPYNIPVEDYSDDEPLEVGVCRRLLLDIMSEIRKVNTQLPLPLLSWLKCREAKDDCISHLADDALNDCNFPSLGNLEDYLGYIANRTIDPAVTRAMLEAWMECDRDVLKALRISSPSTFSVDNSFSQPIKDKTATALSHREILALKLVEEEWEKEGGKQGVPVNLIAPRMQIKGANVERLTRSTLDRLQEKGFLKKIRSAGRSIAGASVFYHPA